MDLSVVLPVMNERDNLRALLPRLHAMIARELHLGYEILVIDGDSTDGTREAASRLGARVVPERRRGYAGALTTGLAEAHGDYILTLDADMSHDPEFVAKMWRARERGRHRDRVALRARRGRLHRSRPALFELTCSTSSLRRMLSMPVRDLSSGFRLYRRAAVEKLELDQSQFRNPGRNPGQGLRAGLQRHRSSVHLFPARGRAVACAGAALRHRPPALGAKLWQLRNSLASADYDERAFYSIIPLQRYWQRRRHAIMVLVGARRRRMLDAGCGSSIIIQSLNNAVGMDISYPSCASCAATGFRWCAARPSRCRFKDQSFDCVISSQVIEQSPTTKCCSPRCGACCGRAGC